MNVSSVNALSNAGNNISLKTQRTIDKFREALQSINSEQLDNPSVTNDIDTHAVNGYVAIAVELLKNNHLTPDEYVRVLFHSNNYLGEYEQEDYSPIFNALKNQNWFNSEGLDNISEAITGNGCLELFREANCVNYENIEALCRHSSEEILLALDISGRFGLDSNNQVVNDIVGIFRHVKVFEVSVNVADPISGTEKTEQTIIDIIEKKFGAEPNLQNRSKLALIQSAFREVIGICDRILNEDEAARESVMHLLQNYTAEFGVMSGTIAL